MSTNDPEILLMSLSRATTFAILLARRCFILDDPIAGLTF